MAAGDLCTLAQAKAWLKIGQTLENLAVPATGPYTVTVSRATQWNGDGGVSYASTGVVMTRVTGVPTIGQYSVTAGVYTFAAADAGAKVAINYLTQTVDDNLLADLITAASNFIQNAYLGRSIAVQSYSETLNGVGCKSKIGVKNTPITTVASVTIDGKAVPASPGWGRQGFTWSDREIGLVGYSTFRGFQNIVLAYTAGYATIPPALVQVCIDLVALRYKERDRIGMSSKTLDKQVIAYNTKDLTEPIRMVLDKYKRVVPL